MSLNESAIPVKLRLERLFAKPSSGVVALLIGFIIVTTTFFPAFLTLGNWQNVLDQMVFLLLLTVGMTIVLIVRGIDLSVGSVMALSAGVPAVLITQGLILPLALLAGIAVGAFAGFLNALMITKLGLPDFVATLAMMGVARGVLFMWTEGTPFTRYMTPEYRIVGGQVNLLGFINVPLFIAAAVCIAGWFLLRKSVLGRHLYAVGGGPDAARLSGVSVSRIKTYAYMISGTCAGLAGVLLAGRATNVAPTMGAGYEILAITAAIIGGAALAGGRGGILGAILGALTIAFSGNAMNIAGISSEWQQVVTGIILVIAVLLTRLSMYFNERLRNSALEHPVNDKRAPSPQAAT